MNDYDDDALDRMLAALPLEEPPTHLHARILAATVYAPPVAQQRFAGWELWLVGLLSALAVWLTWAVLTEPNLTQRVTTGFAALFTAGFTSTETLAWLAGGAALAWCVSAFQLPRLRIHA